MQSEHRPKRLPDAEIRSRMHGPPVEQAQSDILDIVRSALEDRRAMLAFQPVVQARRPRRVAFYEGLIRLLDPSGRVIPAAAFMEAVEATDLGRKIDCIALELGLAALAQEPSIRLSVNLSARSIGNTDWLKALEQGLAGAPEIAERLIVEITESSAMSSPEIVARFMQDMQDRGICFALDDFGAGYTAFRYLRDFRFDIVKIDGSFIRNRADLRGNQVLIRALVSIARHFDMFTVAECVETEDDARLMVELGVDCLQGYHFGAPSIHPPWHMAARRPGQAGSGV